MSPKRFIAHWETINFDFGGLGNYVHKERNLNERFWKATIWSKSRGIELIINIQPKNSSGTLVLVHTDMFFSKKVLWKSYSNWILWFKFFRLILQLLTINKTANEKFWRLLPVWVRFKCLSKRECVCVCVYFSFLVLRMVAAKDVTIEIRCCRLYTEQ